MTGSFLRQQYNEAIQAIIRPDRQTYTRDCLGPQIFTSTSGKTFRRVDQYVSHPEQIIEVSAFIPFDESYPHYIPPTIILFCHCNSSNRLECMQYLDYLPVNYAIASFDFIGCGNSKGTYVTLGLKESQQIKLVIRTLQKQFSRVILWGRSMGAVSSIIYGENTITVVDSPFYSLKKLSKDKIKKSWLFKMFFSCLWGSVEADIMKQAKFSIDDLNTSEYLKRMNPNNIVIFLVGIQDDFIHPSHIEKLYQKFRGHKKALLYIQGDHFSPRGPDVFREVLNTIDSFQSLPHQNKIGYDSRTLSYIRTSSTL